VQVGDRLLRVNDVSCVGMTIDAIKSYVVGPVGTRVGLVFGRHKEIITVELERFARPTSMDAVYLPLLAAAESEGDAVGKDAGLSSSLPSCPSPSSRQQTQTNTAKSGYPSKNAILYDAILCDMLCTLDMHVVHVGHSGILLSDIFSLQCVLRIAIPTCRYACFVISEFAAYLTTTTHQQQMWTFVQGQHFNWKFFSSSTAIYNIFGGLYK
jgi:hypothetical protein